MDSKISNVPYSETGDKEQDEVSIICIYYFMKIVIDLFELLRIIVTSIDIISKLIVLSLTIILFLGINSDHFFIK